MVGMSGWANAKLGTYSKGMQQRVGLAQALVNDPRLVVLDEPTDGLDPVGRQETRGLLQRLRDQGRTVFLNSHLLGEVERVCDRVAILVGGKVIRQGTLDELTAGTEHYEIILQDDRTDGMRGAIRAALPCKLEPAHPSVTTAAAGEVAPAPVTVEQGTLPSGEPVELDGTTVRIGTAEPATIQPILNTLRSQKLVIQSVRLTRQSLEDFFIQTVSGSQSERAVPQRIAKGGQP
jgi:ABC-2 type transport system ATP-binding protein